MISIDYIVFEGIKIRSLYGEIVKNKEKRKVYYRLKY